MILGVFHETQAFQGIFKHCGLYVRENCNETLD